MWNINKNVESVLSEINVKDWRIWRKILDGWWFYSGKVLCKIIIIIGIKKFDDTNILIDTNDKLPDHVALKNVVI